MCFIFSCCLPRQERESADEPVAEAVRRVSASIDDVEDAGDASSTKVKSVEVSVSQKDVGDGHSVIETWQEEEENVALVGESSVSVREGQSSHWWIKKSVMPWKGLNKSHKTRTRKGAIDDEEIQRREEHRQVMRYIRDPKKREELQRREDERLAQWRAQYGQV